MTTDGNETNRFIPEKNDEMHECLTIRRGLFENDVVAYFKTSKKVFKSCGGDRRWVC